MRDRTFFTSLPLMYTTTHTMCAYVYLYASDKVRGGRKD